MATENRHATNESVGAPALDALGEAGRTVFTQHAVRQSEAQKEAFRAYAQSVLQAAGWQTEVEMSGRLIKSRNLVAGNVKTARLVLTAHYDTPARLPFPNFIAPRNLLVTLLYQVVLALFICIPVFIAAFLPAWLGVPFLPSMLISLAVAALAIWLLLAGPANKNNANDNTSGVLTLLEAAAALPPEARDGVALVFFDNEELGLVGSAAFKKRHGALADKLLLNFDCVGVGDTLLFCLPGALRKNAAEKERLGQAFAPAVDMANDKSLILDTSPFTLYPSDQLHFARGVGVAALRSAPVLGLYMSRIHTGRDTLLWQENITLLRDGIVKLAAALPASEET